MKIHSLPDGDAVHYYKQALVVTFAGKRHVISTGPNNGGYREDLLAVFNRDDNPGPGMACVMRDKTYEGHMNIVALEDLGLDPERCSGLCTAASMENASIQTQSYRDLVVTAIVTAGIEHNGGRAGDPASYHEENGHFLSLPEEDGTREEAPVPGTINVIMHISASLDAGTLARTIMTVTEAKTAVLQELQVRSHHSDGLATGSGTDGIISVCNPGSALKLTNAGKNSKLGELIGKTVKSALKEALYKQSGLCPQRQRDVLRIMGRFGVDEDRLWAEAKKKGSGHADFSKAEYMDWLDRRKTSGKIIGKAFLAAHILDLLAWKLISKEEASSLAADLLGTEEGEKTPLEICEELLK